MDTDDSSAAPGMGIMELMGQYHQLAAAAGGYIKTLLEAGFDEHLAQAIAAQWLCDMQRRIMI